MTEAGRKGRTLASASASNNEIYKAIGEFGSAIKAIERGVDDIKRDLAASELASSNSRAGIHRRLDEQLERLTNVEHDVGTLKNKVTDMETVTVSVKTLTTKAEGAGTLGRVLLRIGVVIVTIAGWAAAGYTHLTGRPPP